MKSQFNAPASTPITNADTNSRRSTASQVRLGRASWNETQAPYPEHATLHALLRDRAARADAALAVTDGLSELTYEQLERRSNALAAALAARGAGPETLIGVCFERSVDMVVALLAVLKTGAAYVPLDPGYPPGRIGFMVEDARVAFLLTQRNVEASLPGPAVLLDDLDLSDEPADLPDPAAASDLAYVIYTSGSTGRPKGVEITHRSVVNLLFAMRTLVDFTAAERLLAVTSISFDISVLELFLPLLFGGTLIIAARAETMDGGRLRARLEQSRASLMQATPVTWRLLIGAGWQPSPGFKALSGGEAIDPGLARQLLARTGRFWNVYGPTETTIWSAAAEIARVEGPRVPIGRPLANTRLYLLDAQLRPVPVGEIGELYIAGAGVARGYLRRPELTAERFLADPIAGTGRMYKTGDLARRLRDGAIEFLGRADEQIKLRGFRIELGEIEAVLDEFPGVRQAAVAVGRSDAASDGELIAFVVAADGPPPVDQLKEFAGATLPDYMVPTRIVLLRALPLTPNGKVDRRRLLALVPQTIERGDAHQPPTDAIETQLAAMFEDVLGVRPVGIDDDFFALGGHSLRAALLLARIERRFGRQIHVNTLYHQGSSVAYLASVLRARRPREKLPYLLPLTAHGTRDSARPVFCMHTLHQATLFYYQPLAARLAADATLLGILPQGLGDGLAPHATIEEMAAHCIGLLRGRQPHGPYRLCGYSTAGVVAFEAARQLRAAGEEIESLMLIDAYCPSGARTWRYWPSLYAERLGRWQVVLATHRPGFGRTDPEALANRALQRSHAAAFHRYRAGRYDGDIILFAAQETLPLFSDACFGWEHLASRVERHVLPGDHHAMIYEPGVGALGGAVRRCLGLGSSVRPSLQKVPALSRD
jgi:amino acid adenylation domain-containing protein